MLINLNTSYDYDANTAGRVINVPDDLNTILSFAGVGLQAILPFAMAGLRLGPFVVDSTERLTIQPQSIDALVVDFAGANSTERQSPTAKGANVPLISVGNIALNSYLSVLCMQDGFWHTVEHFGAWSTA